MERAQLIWCLRETGVAEERNGFTFLCDPKWTQVERERITALQSLPAEVHPGKNGNSGWLCVPTGGTSGGVRFARHDEVTLGAAVRGFCDFFGMSRVNAIDVLPAYHVSGLMARVRTAATGGRHVNCDWRRLEKGERPKLEKAAGEWVISLVPTQLQRLMATSEAMGWLRGFRNIFVGGGPAWPELTQLAAAAELPISLTYGMTETAAMIAAMKPEEFLAGERSTLTVMPHAQVRIADDEAICIEGASVFRGYLPEFRTTQCFETEDLGRIVGRGRLQIFGRKDAVIITGGKKVQPTDVEAALQATGQFSDVVIVGVPDQEWGELVVACYPQTIAQAPDLKLVERGLVRSLASHQRPKRYVAIADWPRNAQGKVNRRELVRLIQTYDV